MYCIFQAGYDTINSTHHFSIPGSFSDTATGRNSTFRLGSNVNIPGRWAFRIDNGERGCYSNGKIRRRGSQQGAIFTFTSINISMTKMVTVLQIASLKINVFVFMINMVNMVLFVSWFESNM